MNAQPRRKQAEFKCRRKPSELLLECCRITGCPGCVTVDGRVYDYWLVPDCGPEVVVCYRMKEHKPGLETDEYTLTLLRSGQIDCTCADAVFVAGPLGQLCKHGHACTDLRLFPDTKTEAAPKPPAEEAPF